MTRAARLGCRMGRVSTRVPKNRKESGESEK